MKYWLTFVLGRECVRIYVRAYALVSLRVCTCDDSCARCEPLGKEGRKSNEGEDTADWIGGKSILFLHRCCLKNVAIVPLCAHILDNLRGYLSCSLSADLFGSSSNICRTRGSTVMQSSSVMFKAVT